MPPLSPSDVWWARVRRAERRLGLAGSKLMSDHAREVLGVICEAQEGLELVPGRGWVEVPPERRREEYIARERRRLCDQLGRELGVGPMPC